jgi:DNA-damage-inducible protein D
MGTNTEIAKLFASFEDCRFEHEGVEAWRARGLMPYLGYAKWQTFREAVKRAWESCVAAGVDPGANFLVGDGTKAWHPDEVFTEVSKNPQGGRPSEDVILTRRAAYLVAMNGDTTKPEVGFAQHYFATATRTTEVLAQRMAETARLQARDKLTETEKRFQGVLYQADVDGPGISRIRSKGDQALFGGNSTEDMKKKWGIKGKRPLADFAPEVVIVAKQLGAAITTHNVKKEGLRGEEEITAEHKQNNKTIRATLGERGIVPEELPPEEDIKKVERRHASEARALTKEPTAKKIKSTTGKAKGKPA